MSAQPIDSGQVLQQLPQSLQKWLDLERFHLHRTDVFQNLARDPEFDTRYLPQNCGAVELPCFWVKRKHLLLWGRMADSSPWGLCSGDGPDEQVLFPIHPMCVASYREFLSQVGASDAGKDGVRIWGVPTSSIRTMLAWPDEAPQKAHFIKLTLHSPAFGDRRLYTKLIGRSVGLSSVVQRSRALLPASFDFLAEPMGWVPRSLPDSGVLIRSIPQEIKDGRVLLAPLFSLMGTSGNRLPLLLTLLERNRMQLRDFLQEALCAPFARLWLEMSLKFGIVLEAHGQDLMLALSPALAHEGRIFYRDFEGVQMDWELRHRLGMPAPADLPHAWRWRETYGTWGYPLSECLWYKWKISLFQFMHFVLNELELAARQWHENGLLNERAIDEGEITMMFSRRLTQAIAELFGVRLRAEYNFYHQLNKFLLLLYGVRKDILLGSASN